MQNLARIPHSYREALYGADRLLKMAQARGLEMGIISRFIRKISY